MRIAYIVHYQGPGFAKERPCLHNLSLGSKAKVELIAELLRGNAHEVEIMSQGEVDRNEFKFYPFFMETEPFHPAIPIYYASAIPVRFVTGFWSAMRTEQLLKARNRVSPFDVVIIQTMKRAQLACAHYAMQQLGIPAILEYEDDHFRDVQGREPRGLKASIHKRGYRRALKTMSGCMAVSPYLLAQLPSSTPKLLLRGVVNDHIVNMRREGTFSKGNRVVFSGTHEGTQGLEQLLAAWQTLRLRDWELHIAGTGPITHRLQDLAKGDSTVVFHGFLDREENARLLCSAKIGMNPQDVTKFPGTSFAFKIIEYLAAGAHVITTPRGSLEAELEAGVTYIHDNTTESIATALRQVIDERRYEHSAEEATLRTYGPAAIAKSLDRLLEEATDRAA